ncbi:hypothetical protein PSAB6_110117 [Paraburkholderia sabiae]|nr:hypothetical protein PSAB6_110117 [Paraburkholderia sabiae]
MAFSTFFMRVPGARDGDYPKGMRVSSWHAANHALRLLSCPKTQRALTNIPVDSGHDDKAVEMSG